MEIIMEEFATNLVKSVGVALVSILKLEMPVITNSWRTFKQIGEPKHVEMSSYPFLCGPQKLTFPSQNQIEEPQAMPSEYFGGLQ